jgi:two-component system, chemotaxis family, chemotaxis protein CheY
VKTLLVVDDSETIRLEVNRVATSAGFTVLQARDGAEGLKVAGENPELALIVLDVNMPVMNGLEALERLKQNPEAKEIPVLLLTTEVQESLMQRAKTAGAKAWLVKPVNREMLLKAIQRIAR